MKESLKCLNHLLVYKIFAPFKLKAFVDDSSIDSSNGAEMKHVFFDSEKNIVRKGENAVNKHFLLLPQCLQKPS